MSFNPLLLNDTLFPIIQWINQYDSSYDIRITTICLHRTCKFLLDTIKISNHYPNNFYHILTLSTINNQEIFKWFHIPSSYDNIWTLCYAASRGDLEILKLCYEKGVLVMSIHVAINIITVRRRIITIINIIILIALITK